MKKLLLLILVLLPSCSKDCAHTFEKAVIALASMINPGLRERQEDVDATKANMVIFQKMVETYALDWNVRYPDNVSQLHKESKRFGYYKDFKNPITGNSWEVMDGEAAPPKYCRPGFIYYTTIGYFPYQITACDPAGFPLYKKAARYMLKGSKNTRINEP